MHISQASTLFEEYLRILNEIVAEQEDTALARLLESQTAPVEGHMVVALVAGAGRLEVEHFDVRLEEGRFRITGRAVVAGDDQRVWLVPLETVKDTLGREEHFRAHPEDLDLRWLQVGIQQQRGL